MGATLSKSKKSCIPSRHTSVDVDTGSKRSKKRLIDKSTIGKPVDFIHLSHAGMDLTENNPTLIPVERAQIPDIQMASSNYANSYSFKLMQKQLQNHDFSEEWKPFHKRHIGQQTYSAGSRKDTLDHTALFFDDLYTILHERTPINTNI